MKAYVFVGMAGTQRAVTDDMTGANLPPAFGNWTFDRTIEDITSGIVFTTEDYEAFRARGYWISRQT